MDKHIYINTLEELVAFGVNYSRERFELEESWATEWVNPKEGEYWLATSPKYVSRNDPGRAEYEAAEEAHKNARPKDKSVKHWFLKERGRRYGKSTYFHVGETLAKKLDAIWTKGTRGRFNDTQYRLGYMSVAGMLKRLTGSDGGIKKQVEAHEAKMAEDLKAHRIANMKKHIAGMAADLIKELAELKDEGVSLTGSQADADYLEMLAGLLEDHR